MRLKVSSSAGNLNSPTYHLPGMLTDLTRKVAVLAAEATSTTIAAIKTRSSGKNKFAYFPYTSHLFEVLEPNLMELNLSERSLTLFN
jgi:hypothetical protein